MSQEMPGGFYEALSYIDPTGTMSDNLSDKRMDMLETKYLYDDHLHRMRLDAAREIFEKEIYDFEKKQEPKPIEAAQGGRVGLAYGGGFADTLAGEIMAEEDEFMKVADVTSSDILNINTMKMSGYGVQDMRNVKGALSDNITDEEIKGVMKGTITEPGSIDPETGEFVPEKKGWFGIF